MKPDDLQKHISSTYFGLRLGIVLFSFALPLVLYFGGLRRGFELAPSISDYYFWGGGLMRDWFVANVFAVAGFLYLYKGYSRLENVLLNVGAVLLAVVALVPCSCNDPGRNGSLHGAAAVGFFLLMAFVVIKCANDTLPLLDKQPEQRDAFTRRYRLIAVFLIASPAAAVVISIWLRQFASYTFFVESFAIYVFATYWAVKSRELSLTQAETLALEKRAKTEPGQGIVKVDTASV